MQVKLFRQRVAELSALETDVNQWLSANPKLIPIQRETSVFHDQGAGAEQVLISVWYEAKGNL